MPPSHFETTVLAAGTAPDATPRARAGLLAGAAPVSRIEAALSRLLGRGLQLVAPDPALQWQVLPPAAPAAPVPDSACLLLDTAAGALCLQDGARFIAGLTGIDGSACDGRWPPWMVGAVAGRLGGTPLANVRAISPGAVPASPLLWLPWRLQERSHAITALAGATPATWHALLEPAARIALRMPWSDWLALVLERPVVLAAHRLPLTLFETLSCGDVIVPEQAYFDCAGRGRVTFGQRRWHVAMVGPRHLQLINEENTLDTDLTDAPALEHDAEYDDGVRDGVAVEGADASRGDADEDFERAMLGAVNVTLRFELGHCRLTLDQLRALGPHSVLEVLAGSPHEIAIMCGATSVGRGEVVDVDGRLGVRITCWSAAC